ncbi:MAG: tRNA lysidine(34) synthetase TilS [Planctomycetes bacterium]|nr:tRNA lysidine(34) synthetase TilS [Planctomycetota bacterium]
MAMDTRHFHKLLFDAAKRLIPPGSTVACAVSAGPDSVALLHALHRVNELRKLGLKLCIAHLDHRLPPNNSAEMAAFTRTQADALKLPYYEETINVPALAKATGESIEEAGRKARYAFFERAAAHLESPFVAVAHQADDQAETILHRILRGTSLKGLGGIPEKRQLSPDSKVAIVRPMLAHRRADIMAYTRRRNIQFMHDETNDDAAAATRNRIRNELLPLIRKTINPNVDTALVRLSRHAHSASNFMTEAAEALFESAASCANCEVITLRVGALTAASPALLNEIILMSLRRTGAQLKSIGSERIAAIADALKPTVERRLVQLSKGHIAERRGKYLHIRCSSDAAGLPESIVSAPPESAI